jgi:hypothetical protein
VNILGKEPNLPLQEKQYLCTIPFFKRHGGNKKLLLEMVDTLENITYSLTKSLSVVKLSWCREAIGINSLVL